MQVVAVLFLNNVFILLAVADTENYLKIALFGGGGLLVIAGIYLARIGYTVLILEKSREPGHRNVSGGVIYGKYKKGYSLIDLLPDFEEEAPVERKIIDHSICILSNVEKSSGEYSLQYDGSYNYQKYVFILSCVNFVRTFSLIFFKLTL